MALRIIQYSVFSHIKELDDQVFSGRQLAHGIAAGTTISLEVPPRSEPRFLAYQYCLNSREKFPIFKDMDPGIGSSVQGP